MCDECNGDWLVWAGFAEKYRNQSPSRHGSLATLVALDDALDTDWGAAE